MYSAKALFSLPKGWIMRFNSFRITWLITFSFYFLSFSRSGSSARDLVPLGSLLGDLLGEGSWVSLKENYPKLKFWSIFLRKPPYPKLTLTNLDSGLSLRTLCVPILAVMYWQSCFKVNCSWGSWCRWQSKWAPHHWPYRLESTVWFSLELGVVLQSLRYLSWVLDISEWRQAYFLGVDVDPLGPILLHLGQDLVKVVVFRVLAIAHLDL